MSPVYADHPFPLIVTPDSVLLKDGKKPDMFDHCASEMALVHNMMVRGLNSIYLQAPHIKPSEQRTFCKYIMSWYNLLRIHHTGEEEEFFPDMEKLAGETGIMEANVEQHHAFHDGLEAFVAYAGDCAAGKDQYDAAKLLSMIDSFGKLLMEHLADEIPTIQGLRKYGDEKFATLQKRFDQEGEKNMKELGSGGMCFCVSNLDIHYENDLHTSWPPAPWLVMFLARNVFWWMSASQLKFGACDRFGNMKPLYAVPENKSS